MIAVVTRGGSAIGVFLAPFSLDHIGIGGTMMIAGGILLLGAAISAVRAPETTGLDLDEASDVQLTGTPTAPASRSKAVESL